jgi:hypothetical protein
MCGDGMPDTAGGRNNRPPAPTPFDWLSVRSALRNRISNKVTKSARNDARSALNHLLDRMKVTNRLIHEYAVSRSPIAYDDPTKRSPSPTPDPTFLSLRMRALDSSEDY